MDCLSLATRASKCCLASLSASTTGHEAAMGYLHTVYVQEDFCLFKDDIRQLLYTIVIIWRMAKGTWW